MDGYGIDDVLVGAPGYDGTATDDGRIYLFRGTPDGPSAEPLWTFDGGQDCADLGWSVAGAGDLNGDGYADVAAGAPFYDGGHSDEGRVWVFYGSPSGLSLTPDWWAEADQVGAFFGFSASGGGDVNGDGYDDLLVGAYG